MKVFLPPTEPNILTTVKFKDKQQCNEKCVNHSALAKQNSLCGEGCMIDAYESIKDGNFGERLQFLSPVRLHNYPADICYSRAALTLYLSLQTA